MKNLSNLPLGCSDSDIPGNRPEDEAFEKWIDDNCEWLLEKFLKENPGIHKDNFDEDGKWDSFLNDEFDQAILTRGADEERP